MQPDGLLSVPEVAPLDAQAMKRASGRLQRLTKPPGSLGLLEGLAVQMAGITGRVPPPVPERPWIVVFAADHGVAARGVSAYPQAVTAQMVANFLRGGAAISVLAGQVGARLWVVDVGVAGELPAGPLPGRTAAGAREGGGRVRFWHRRVRPGTRDLSREPAMTLVEAWQAVELGRAVVRQAREEGAGILVLGEMGIGNTTSASALAAVFTGAPLERVVGPGTGLDPAGIERKRAVIHEALERHRPTPDTPLRALAAVGGLEIAALAGALVEASALRLPAILDGFVVAAAALVASALAPGAERYWIAGHRSAEPGHTAALEHLGLRPLLELGMRLGEATGAALALPIVQAACRLCRDMATFEEAGVSGPR